MKLNPHWRSDATRIGMFTSQTLADIEPWTATRGVGVQAAGVAVCHKARLHLAGACPLGKKERSGERNAEKESVDKKSLHLEIPLRNVMVHDPRA
jgi:hypothetical protein